MTGISIQNSNDAIRNNCFR